MFFRIDKIALFCSPFSVQTVGFALVYSLLLRSDELGSVLGVVMAKTINNFFFKMARHVEVLIHGTYCGSVLYSSMP